ncbi:MAG: zinc finger domain-containing protein [Anaerolineales bacterium]
MKTGEPCPRCGNPISLVGANQRITNFWSHVSAGRADQGDVRGCGRLRPASTIESPRATAGATAGNTLACDHKRPIIGGTSMTAQFHSPRRPPCKA